MEQQQRQQGEWETTRIRLFCPSMSKMVQIIVAGHQKLDLGSISRAFGLDPATLKLNGHFISRGVDLIASSVTWNSLIRFFSARGFSTGASDSDALLVDGKHFRIGSKRPHEDAGNGILDMSINNCSRYNKKPQHQHTIVLENERPNANHSGRVDSTIYQTMGSSNGLGLKRKWCEEDGSHVKRTKPEEECFGAVKGY